MNHECHQLMYFSSSNLVHFLNVLVTVSKIRRVVDHLVVRRGLPSLSGSVSRSYYKSGICVDLREFYDRSSTL